MTGAEGMIGSWLLIDYRRGGPVDGDYLRTMFHHGGAVGDENQGCFRGLLLVVLDEVVEQLAFGMEVQGAGGFVQEEDGSFSQQGACDGDALCLSFREPCPIFADDGV